MKETKDNLPKKISWAYSVRDVWPLDIKIIAICQQLEDEGFGMLASKYDPKTIDYGDFIVCPDGSILTLEWIETYWEDKERIFDPENLEDVKMHKANMYYWGFKL